MPRIKVKVNGLSLYCQIYGSDNHPALLLIQGLAVHYAAWPQKLIGQLVASGYRVVLFDNRDAGQSDHLDHLPTPSIALEMIKKRLGLRPKAAYALEDMMQDTRGLLAKLEIESAHLIGISMGGMIAQLLAIRYPKLVKSLTLIATSTSNPKLPGIRTAVRRDIMSGPRSNSMEDRIAFIAKAWRIVGSPGYPVSEEQRRQGATMLLRHGISGAGAKRQLAAILAAPSRVEALHKLKIPTLVIHGENDPILPLQCGQDTANAIPNAKLEIIEGYGHDLPAGLLEHLQRLIIRHIQLQEFPNTE